MKPRWRKITCATVRNIGRFPSLVLDSANPQIKVIKIKLSKAFTLIELLVVIGIISVLIAILMPALSAVLETSRTTKCSSNLRQIVAAMFLYAGENGGYFPESGGTIPWGTKDSTTNKASWMEQLSVYMNLSTGTT